MTPPMLGKRVASARNIYAHNIANDPSVGELVLLTEQLKVLMEALLLGELGFDERRIVEMLRRARRFEYIRHLRRHGGL